MKIDGTQQLAGALALAQSGHASRGARQAAANSPLATSPREDEVSLQSRQLLAEARAQRLAALEQAEKDSATGVDDTSAPGGAYIPTVEETLETQRDGMNSTIGVLERQRALATALSDKIDAYQRVAAGDFSDEALEAAGYNRASFDFAYGKAEDAMKAMASAQAGQLQTELDRLAENLSDVVRINLEFNATIARMRSSAGGAHDEVYQATKQYYEGMSAYDLGLADVEANRNSITSAIDGAIAALQKRAGVIEDAFAARTGQAMAAYADPLGRSAEQIAEDRAAYVAERMVLIPMTVPLDIIQYKPHTLQLDLNDPAVQAMKEYMQNRES